MDRPQVDQKAFVKKVIEETGCTYEQAMFVLGHVLELTQQAYIQGYNRAVNQRCEPFEHKED